ncbi:MAG: hypothetical protein SGJ21_05880 [Alphaproteobacteria bacterium]|nr:hypothetical protein [Alphaproteobacteria bacterium]
MNPWLAATAATRVQTAGIHLCLGGREIARPLLDSGIRPVPKHTNYFCWHMVTLTLIGFGGAFAGAATYFSNRALAASASPIAALGPAGIS